MKSCWIVVKDHKAALEWREVPVPQPKPDQVVIKVHAAAMNRGELVVGGAVHGGPEKLGRCRRICRSRKVRQRRFRTSPPTR